MIRRIALATLVTAASAAPAFAHLQPAEHGSFAAGLSHPLFGLDHILAMVAVGLWAALLAVRGPKSVLWLAPIAFVVAMAAGFAAALAGLSLPFVEPVVLASAVVIGLLAATALSLPASAAMALVGFFAFFHGHAHGSELGSAGALSLGLGFALSTALLNLAGIGTGLGLRRVFGGKIGPLATRVAGGAAALGGLWLSLGS
jgi:urease accessory protein